MKLLSLFILFGLSSVLCFSQEVNALNEIPSESISLNIERYSFDYELIGHSFSNGDSTILDELNIDGMLLSRKTNIDIEITDLEYGVRILIYSESRAKAARNTKRIKPSSYKNTTK